MKIKIAGGLLTASAREIKAGGGGKQEKTSVDSLQSNIFGSFCS